MKFFICNGFKSRSCIVAIKLDCYRYLQSCKDEIWRSISKYLIVDVPKLLKSAEITNVQEAVSVVLGLLPGKPEKVTSFVKWIAEVKRADAAPTNGSNEADLALNAKVVFCILLIPYPKIVQDAQASLVGWTRFIETYTSARPGRDS